MMGKPIAQSRAEFERTVVERALHLCSIAPAALADEVLPAKPGFRRFIRHEPVGVVLDIAAWNYPLAIAVNVIVPAVLAGNAVLVKHASQTALVAEQFERAFLEAGAPAGLVQAMPMDHETTARLIGARALGYVSFTGSVRGGHEVYRALAADNFIAAGFELGGKDPALVLEDADVAFAAENLVDGAFYNAGQSCCGIERIYVADAIYDDFVEAFVALSKRYVVGDPLDPATTLGPMVDREIGGLRARPGRARDRSGGEAPRRRPRLRAAGPLALLCGAPGPGRRRPLDGADDRGDLRPGIGIMRVSSESEGLALMNDSALRPHGLDLDRRPRPRPRLATDVEAGTVFVNRCDYLDPGLAWTGVKDSGFGCSLSSLGFRSVTRPKSHHLRQQPR
jgi:acyl-CoA reductase-like NAD-dependent aldehyde dehydrogenase